MLPRAFVAIAGGGLLLGAGLMAGRGSLAGLRLPAAAVAVAAVVAALLTVAPAVTIAGAYGRYESLPMRLAYLALFCGAAWIGERRRTVAAFLAGCGVAAVETLYEVASHSLPRPDGNVGNAGLLGALLAMAVPLAAGRAVAATPAARRAWIGLAGLLAAALVASTSRSAWLGAVLGLGVLAFFLVRGRWRWGVLAAGVATLAAAAALIAQTPLRQLNDDTGEARLGVWRDSLSVIAERPVAGWGEDTMGLVFGSHQSSDWGPGHNFDRAHSMPLDLAAAQGVLGLAACAWLMGAWWLLAWRRRREPGVAGVAGAAAAYLAWALVNFDWVPATAAFWLLAGCAAGAVGAVRADAAAPTRAYARGRIVLAGGALLAGLALAVPPQVADVFSYLGRPDRAAAIDPLQPAYQAARGDLDGLRRAARLGDSNPATYVALGDAEAAAGHRGAAVAAYRQALERYPFDADARQRLAARGESP